MVAKMGILFLGSPFRNTNLDLSIYTKKDLSDKFKLYWRILKDEKEIEVVMVVNGTSYAGKINEINK